MMVQRQVAGITLTPIAEPDFPVVRELASTIWRQHYTGLISATQIDYMLSGRFSDEALREYLHAADRWFEVLRLSGEPVGYCSCELAAESPVDLKLGQLYVLGSHRGMGLGTFMLGHVEARAHDLGRENLCLQVNKQNTAAIGFYTAAGFTVRREAVFNIGAGFVMDDYVMEKPVQGI